MRWLDISFDPPARVLRQFAGTWLVFVGSLAAWQGLIHERLALAGGVGVAALLVGGLGLWRPALVRPLFVALTVAAFPVGWLLSWLVVMSLFYGVFTPLALLFRVVGRDALALKRSPQRPTYWVPRPASTNPRNYFHTS
jgi:hypothetical protein